MQTDITLINADITRQLADPKVAAALVETTFKGLTLEVAKKAILEGVIRGFEFKDFLEKNVYAIPYGGNYSLVTSVDHARKRGMKSGIVGVEAPVYEMDPEDSKKILSCSITVKRKVGEYVGDFTAQVYFDEYTTGKNLWTSKPRTMIAKVAEMHALRKACPEELAQMYTEEELLKVEQAPFDVEPHYQRLSEVTTLEDLKTTWSSMPGQAKKDKRCEALKDELKSKLTPPPISPVISREETKGFKTGNEHGLS
jgi:hypothetical protein